MCDLGGRTRQLPQAEEGQGCRVPVSQRRAVDLGLSWSLFSIRYSEGAKVFDSANNPVFDDKFRKVLQMRMDDLRRRAGAANIFTIDQEGSAELRHGQAQLHGRAPDDQKVLNDPKLSQIAGAVKNTLMPGATRSTFCWASLYLMGAHPIDNQRAWNLMQFFGGKAEDGH